MQSEETRDKRSYRKPELKRVELRQEESLASSCKMPSVSGATGSDCFTPAQCFDAGS